MIKGFICLRISGLGLDIQSITNSLKVRPDKAYKKGDSYVDIKYGNEPIVYQEDCWRVQIKTQSEESIEEALERFIDTFIPAADYLNSISSKFDATIWVSTYPESEQVNIRISPKAIHNLCKLGVALDVGAIYLKQFYEGTY